MVVAVSAIVVAASAMSMAASAILVAGSALAAMPIAHWPARISWLETLLFSLNGCSATEVWLLRPKCMDVSASEGQSETGCLLQRGKKRLKHRS